MKKSAAEPQGGGWRTFDEIRRDTKCGENRLSHVLRAAINSGTAEKFVGTRIGPNGTLRYCVWYRQISK